MTDKSITLQKDKSGNEYFLVTFPYDEKLVSFVRKIPTRKYVASGWKIKADHVTALYVDAFARKLEFELDDLSKDFIEKMKKPIEEEVNIPELKMKLRNFQKIGVNYATKCERCFIADEMGLGKSAEAIASVMALDAFPCVIICPASLKLNWKKEVNMWCDKTLVVIDGLIKEIYEEIDGNKIISNYEIPDYDADFVIINYDILERDKKIKPSLNPKGIEIPNHKDLLSILKFKSIIIDESQYCSNHKSLRTKAVKQISKKIKYRFALSGTPMLNRPKELIPQLDILDRLESLGGFWGFAKRYCVPENAPVLMSDFKNKNISNIVVGDEIIGWKRVGRQQRIVKSKVLNILKRKSELQKLILENGNEIICTPDHKWLNGRYKTQYEYMNAKIGRKLIEIYPSDIKSIIDFNSESYMKGYILGAFRGDGHCTIKTTSRYNYFKNITITGTNNHAVGISTSDIEIIDRIDNYLNILNIKEYHRNKRNDGLYSLNGTNEIFYNFIVNLKLIDNNSMAGFLAGIYDTDGSGKVISQKKISNENTYNLIKMCLENFNVKYTEKKDGMGFFLPMSRKKFIEFWNLINPILQRKLDSYVFNAGGKFKTDTISVNNIISIDGIHDVYTLTTETGNYVVYGMGSKNCNAFEGDFGWDFSGTSNLDELYSKLKQTCFIRRKKEDVLSELPPKQRILLPIELSNREEYNKASKNFIQWIKSKLMDESEYLEELKKIPMLTDSQRTIMSNARIAEKLNKTREAEALVRIEKLKQLVAKGKLSRVKDFIETFLQYDDKLVIFAKHKEIYKSLIDSYKDISVHVIGGMTSKQKDKAVVEFQTNPKIKLFIGALDAAGVGLTLTESSTVAFVEFGWTSAIHDQAEDRCHRIGQKDFVKCYYFYSEKTIDEDILEIVENKRKIASNIMDGLTIVDDADTNDVEKILSKFI